MPTLFILFGLTFRIFTRDHFPPHIHVISQDREAKFAKITEIRFADGRIYGRTDDGRELWQSLLYYKRLLNASEYERSKYEMTEFGIHWDELDEDISFESFEYTDPEPRGVAKAFLTHPEINASAVARRLGIKQSLLAAYISGTKRPSENREKMILDELRRIGQELTEL